MNRYLISAYILVASISPLIALTDKPTSTPENMAYKEYVDLNPKSWVSVILWTTLRDTQFKSGDWVVYLNRALRKLL